MTQLCLGAHLFINDDQYSGITTTISIKDYTIFQCNILSKLWLDIKVYDSKEYRYDVEKVTVKPQGK